MVDKKYPSKNFIGFSNGDLNEKDLQEKTKYYHLFTAHLRHHNYIIRQGLKILSKGAVLCQKISGYKRSYPNLILKKGCNWASMRIPFLEFLVEHESEIIKTFRGTWACDEIYKQSIAWSIDEFKETIFNITDEFIGSQRKIDWERGKPYVFRSEDFKELIESDGFFARKFSTGVDSEIIKKIASNIQLKYK